MGIIFQSDIDRNSICKEEPKRLCTTFCRKFMKRKCAGMKYIQTQDGLWTNQEKYPFPLYKEEHEKNESA